MTPEAETILQKIGQLVTEVISTPWEVAWIDIEIQPGVVSAQGKYVTTSKAEPASFIVPGAVNRLFMQLRQAVKRSDQNAWTKAKFTLKPDGKFETEFHY